MSKKNEKTKNDIIRSIDIHGKLTWLPSLLGHKKFNGLHLGTIKKLADDRNAFIHYKWKMAPDDPKELPSEAEIDKEFKKIKLAVRYMKLYEASILFRKHKKKLNTKIRPR